jgi:hypothetical protein
MGVLIKVGRFRFKRAPNGPAAFESLQAGHAAAWWLPRCPVQETITTAGPFRSCDRAGRRCGQQCGSLVRHRRQ